MLRPPHCACPLVLVDEGLRLLFLVVSVVLSSTAVEVACSFVNINSLPVRWALLTSKLVEDIRLSAGTTLTLVHLAGLAVSTITSTSCCGVGSLQIPLHHCTISLYNFKLEAWLCFILNYIPQHVE